MNLSERIAAVRKQYDHCFGCGTTNPIGLGLDDFTRTDNTVQAVFVPRQDYNGFADLLHGGIVATALDEIMAWTAILVEDTMVMTGKLDLRFKKPAKIDQEYLLQGVLVERRGRRLQITSTMGAEGVMIAEASGLFLATADLS